MAWHAHAHRTEVTPLTIIVTVHAEPQRCICRAAVWAAASRAAASRARGRRRRGRRRRGVEGGGDKGSSGATRAAAICMRAAGRRGWQRRGPRAAATSAATWRRATPATLTRAVAKATPRGLQVRSNSKSCAPIQPTSDCWTCRNLCCSARRPGCQTGQHGKGVGMSRRARAPASLTNRLSSSQLRQPNQRPHR